MFSSDPEGDQDNENVESISNVPSNRRHSLFGSTISGLVKPESPVSILKRRISGSNKSSQYDNMSGRNEFSIMRRNTTTDNEHPMSPPCQRCQRFEVELANTSDSLNATDTELQASRQVISLLQRQLELFQVEKEGLEKLIVSQADESGSESLRELIDSDGKLDDGLLEPEYSDTSQQSPDDTDKKLMKLIRTQLYAKDEEIVKLKTGLKESQNEKEQMNLQIHSLEDELTKLKSDMSLLRENLSLRDQTIVSLSNEVFEQSNPGPQTSYARRQSSAEVHSNRFEQKQLMKLNETLEAHKKTNELLTQNVIKLTDKCANLERIKMELTSQAQELEARCCQIQSKLLSLLKEIEQSSKPNDQQDGDCSNNPNGSIDSESVKQLINRLLKDKSLDIPLSWKEDNRPRTRLKANDLEKLECDELGFYIVSSDSVLDAVTIGDKGSSPTRRQKGSQLAYLKSRINEGIFSTDLTTVDEVDVCEAGEDMKVQVDAQFFRQHSVDALRRDETTWRLYWDEFIKVFDKTNLAKSKEFKLLLRSGVPQEYRCKIWKSLIDLKVGAERRERGPDFYQSLLEPKHLSASPKPGLNPSSKQIELDLLRTLPNNKYFEAIDSPGTVRLRKVLTAFANYAPHIGYCQGMNRLAAVALLILPEEEAFWCLVSIVEKIMPVGYYNDLWLAQVDSNVVLDFVALKMPDLSDHFQDNGIELSLFAWFLTIFVDGTPPALFLRLWDCFLYEGDKIMFRVALALLKMHEDELIKLNSSVTINSFLRAKINDPMDIDHFFKIAFDDINPLPGRLLRQKRENHFRAMRANMISFVSAKESRSPIQVGAATSVSKDEDSPYEESSVISV